MDEKRIDCWRLKVERNEMVGFEEEEAWL
jgi:hypothetical protein